MHKKKLLIYFHITYCSFGRDVSHDDDGVYSDYEAPLSAEKPNLTGNKTNIGRQIIHSVPNPDNGT